MYNNVHVHVFLHSCIHCLIIITVHVIVVDSVYYVYCRCEIGILIIVIGFSVSAWVSTPSTLPGIKLSSACAEEAQACGHWLATYLQLSSPPFVHLALDLNQSTTCLKV